MWRRSFGRGCMSIIGVVVLTLSGCGLLGDSDNSGTAGATVVKVSVMPTTDLAPFHLAMRSGYFEAEGLKIESTTAPSGPASVAKMVSGEVDIAYGSYTPFFTAKAQNTADIKIIAACSSAGPSSTMVVTMPDSSVKSVKDLPGKRVAVTARGTMSDLLTMSAVKSAGVDYQSIQWVTMPFPDTRRACSAVTWTRHSSPNRSLRRQSRPLARCRCSTPRLDQPPVCRRPGTAPLRRTWPRTAQPSRRFGA
ncbi:ABC transporter substrate-binding protein [Kibdelosporangium philippinense]|uniref:ABC transporter substrate-binding protein n=1 Tax=Kibdelosporangium philippinense TaxID=211113 RepID=UPI00361AAEE0